MKLFKHQEEAIDLFKGKNGKLYLNWETGTGKTIGALAIANNHGFKNLLIVAPKSSHLSWQTESQYFPDLNLSIATYEAFRDKINYFSKYDFIIFDEAHRLKNNSAKVTKKAVELAIKGELPQRLLLSGTPADRLYEIYTQLRVLNPYDEMFRRYRAYSYFIKTFFVLDEYYKPKQIVSEWHKEFLKNWFLKYAHVIKKEDVVELPPIIEIDIEFPEEDDNAEYEDLSELTVGNFMKEFRESLTKTKIDWVLDFIEDNPNTIVFSLFKEPVMQIKEKLKNKVYAITGEYREDFDKALRYQDKPIIATYALKEGANLQNYHNVVYLASPLSYRDYHQSLSRVYRTGQKHKVGVYRLMQNRIDYIVYDILNSKASVYDYLRKET
jgi:superfamily II DNA or RNA helicase